MTVREEAYGLIDRLPEDSVKAVIQIMIRMAPEKQKRTPLAASMTPKKKAFLELQKMRKEGAKYDFSMDERATALDEKYGAFVLNGGAQ